MCLIESSDKSRSPCSLGSSSDLSAALLQKTLLWIVLASSALVIASATGCGSRTILVSESSVLRVAPSVRGYAYLWDAEAKEWRIGGTMITYPEGWYLVPPSFVEQDEPLGGAVGATMPNLGARN